MHVDRSLQKIQGIPLVQTWHTSEGSSSGEMVIIIEEWDMVSEDDVQIDSISSSRRGIKCKIST